MLAAFLFGVSGAAGVLAFYGVGWPPVVGFLGGLLVFGMVFSLARLLLRKRKV